MCAIWKSRLQNGNCWTIADTLGIGGIMRGLRTIPVLLEMARDMEELCPNVLHLNYVNPMAINCWALSRTSDIKTVGLCHSVQLTAEELALDIGVPVEEINYLCAGINHMAFYLKFERNGEDLYPLVRQVVEEGRVPEWNCVRYEMFTHLGYFVTESSEHFAEYAPWFIAKLFSPLLLFSNVGNGHSPGLCRDVGFTVGPNDDGEDRTARGERVGWRQLLLGETSRDPLRMDSVLSPTSACYLLKPFYQTLPSLWVATALQMSSVPL